VKTTAVPGLCWCEPWNLTLSEEHILIVLENKVLIGNKRRGNNRKKRKWRDECHSVYSSPNIKKNEIKHVAHAVEGGGEKHTQHISLKPERRYHLGVAIDGNIILK
jgi:hypothetical protein